MPDLKLDTETAVATIGRELDRGIESLRGTAARLVEDLKTVSNVKSDPMLLSIADADAACVIDCTTLGYPVRTIRLELGGGCGGQIDLMSPLPAGRYRAVVLFNKIDESK